MNSIDVDQNVDIVTPLMSPSTSLVSDVETKMVLTPRRGATCSCQICHSRLTNDDLSLTECGHIFHRQCLWQWLHTRSNMSCPLCRTKYENTIDLRIFTADILNVFDVPFSKYSSKNAYMVSIAVALFKEWPMKLFIDYDPQRLLKLAQHTLKQAHASSTFGNYNYAYALVRRGFHLLNGIRISKYKHDVGAIVKEYNKTHKYCRNLVLSFNVVIDDVFATYVSLRKDIDKGTIVLKTYAVPPEKSTKASLSRSM